MAGDSAYTWPMIVVARSLERHGGPSHGVVVDFGLSSADIEQLRTSVPGARIVPPPERLAQIYDTERFHPTVFARLFLSEYFEESVDRVLFIDGDVLVRRSVRELIEIDLRGRTLAAVPINHGADHPIGPLGLLDESYWCEGLMEKAGVPLGAQLFNCGVMVIDLQRWSDERVEERAAELARHFPANDQHLLNALLWNDWLPVPFRWNSKQPDAAIYHFASSPKPWEPGYYRNRARLEYAATARELGWSIPQPRALRTRVLLRELGSRCVPAGLR